MVLIKNDVRLYLKKTDMTDIAEITTKSFIVGERNQAQPQIQQREGYNR